MALTIGTQVGPYEITSPLGEGGMGVVFRARDKRLQRDVAIKVLPDHFAGDPDRLSRFQREAQVLASMNHPHIAQIYGLEQAGASTCIVMELVDGETLAQTIARGVIPIEQCIPIANQIVDALEVAHDRGIVHRDLKPANIKLTREGQVKVLDFGLAKALGEVETEQGLSHSPTKVSGSMAGLIMGTAAYMSPEQARGKTVDARTDIWAFGCVLYEMLSGRQTFEGETATEIIARVLEREPDWSRLPAATPYPIRLLLEATLRKDPKQRLRNIGDARAFLNATPPAVTATSVPERHHRERHAWIVAAVFAVAFVAALVPSFLTRQQPEPLEMRFEMTAPPLSPSSQFPISISQDGQRLAYSATADGKKAIWVRPLGALTAQQIPGTDDGDTPSWSPDGRSILFFASDGKARKVDLASGSLTVLGPVFTQWGTWNNDGVILLAANGNGSVQPSIVRVPASGGEQTRVTIPASNETGHFQPQFLPDGKHFLFLSTIPQGGLTGSLTAASLDSRRDVHKIGDSNFTNLASIDIPPQYTEPGYLLYTRNGTLMAQSFDAKQLKIVGEPVSLAEGVSTFSVSRNVLIYQRGPAGSATPSQQLAWFDRKGTMSGQVIPSVSYAQGIELSPDGHRAAVSEFSAGTSALQDVWTIDLDKKVPTRFTFDPSFNNGPVWSPDGSWIVFGSSRGGGTVPNKIFQKLANGGGAEDLVYALEPQDALYTEDWSRDGQNVVFERTLVRTLTFDIWRLPLSGDKKPVVYLSSPFNKIQAKVSPDGHWLAYSTNESGTYQLVVQTFPDPSGGRRQITANGGVEPRWRRDGRELYYLGLDGKLMAVPIRPDKTFQWGEATPLFQTPIPAAPVIPFPHHYDVTADGQRFLMVVPADAPSDATRKDQPQSTLVAVVNWTSALKKK